MTSRLWADLALLMVAAVWGGTFVMVKEALVLVGPLTFLALRFVLATLALLPGLPRVWKHMTAETLRSGLLVGALLFAGYALQTAGLQFTTASRAGFITGLSIVLVPIGASFLFGARLSHTTLVGVTLATLGLALLSLSPEDLAQFGTGDLLVLGGALGFAGHILAVGHLSPRHDTTALTAAQIAVAAVLALVSAAVFERWTVDGLVGAMPAALFTGLFATVAAFWIQTRAQRFTTATHTALIFALEPVFAALFAYWLANERLGLNELVGCGLMLAGMMVAQIERRRPV